MKSLNILRDKLNDILIKSNGDVKLSEHTDIIIYAKELGLTDTQLHNELNKVDSMINWDTIRQQHNNSLEKANEFKKAVEIQKMHEANASETLQYIIDLCSKDNFFDTNEIKIFFETSDELNQNEISSAKILKEYLDRNGYIPVTTPKGISLRLLLQSTDWGKSTIKVQLPHNPQTKKPFIIVGIFLAIAVFGFILYPKQHEEVKAAAANETEITNNTNSTPEIKNQSIKLDSVSKEEIVSTSVPVENAISENQKDNVERLLTRYYENLNEDTFDANDYFSSNVDQYITYKNISSAEINELHSSEKEYVNHNFKIDKNTLILNSTTNGVSYWEYWGNYSCYRMSKNKNQECQVRVEVGINEDNKMTSYREIEIRNLRFY